MAAGWLFAPHASPTPPRIPKRRHTAPNPASAPDTARPLPTLTHQWAAARAPTAQTAGLSMSSVRHHRSLDDWALSSISPCGSLVASMTDRLIAESSVGLMNGGHRGH